MNVIIIRRPPVATDVALNVVCVSVWLSACLSVGYTAEPIEMPFRMLTLVGPRYHY